MSKGPRFPREGLYRVPCYGWMIRTNLVEVKSPNRIYTLSFMPRSTSTLASFQLTGKLSEHIMNLDDQAAGSEHLATTADIRTLITRSPVIRKGRPRIAGTGVTMQRIVG